LYTTGGWRVFAGSVAARKAYAALPKVEAEKCEKPTSTSLFAFTARDG
jgi:hypothetical protein